MKSTEFHPGDYDVQGRLRLPFLFWCVLLLQARTWVLFVMAGASRGQGDTLLNLFYPDHDAFWLGLLPGVPAVLAFLCSGRRQAIPRFWRALLARASLAADPGAVCASGLATLALALRRAAFGYRDCTGGGGYCRAAVAGHESPFTRLFYARARLKRHFLSILHSNKR